MQPIKNKRGISTKVQELEGDYKVKTQPPSTLWLFRKKLQLNSNPQPTPKHTVAERWRACWRKSGLLPTGEKLVHENLELFSCNVPQSTQHCILYFCNQKRTISKSTCQLKKRVQVTDRQIKGVKGMLKDNFLLLKQNMLYGWQLTISSFTL